MYCPRLHTIDGRFCLINFFFARTSALDKVNQFKQYAQYSMLVYLDGWCVQRQSESDEVAYCLFVDEHTSDIFEIFVRKLKKVCWPQVGTHSLKRRLSVSVCVCIL